MSCSECMFQLLPDFCWQNSLEICEMIWEDQPEYSRSCIVATIFYLFELGIIERKRNTRVCAKKGRDAEWLFKKKILH